MTLSICSYVVEHIE